MTRIIGAFLLVSAVSFLVGRMTAPNEEYIIRGIATNVPIKVVEGTTGSITNSLFLGADGKPPYICLGKCDGLPK